MKKTFVEVIKEIKIGEIWENDFKLITRDELGITVMSKGTVATRRMIFNEGIFYKLKNNTVSFEEAFKAYENGKTIKSLIGEKTEYKKIEKYDLWFNETNNTWNNNYDFDIEEIRGEWEIVD